MSVKPLRDFVVVSKDDAPKQTASGLFIAPVADEKVVTGEVLEVGSGLIAGDGSVIPLEVKAGDKIAFNKNMAVEVKSGGSTYFLLREEHVLCIIRPE